MKRPLVLSLLLGTVFAVALTGGYLYLLVPVTIV